jgi:hypothetical protein
MASKYLRCSCAKHMEENAQKAEVHPFYLQAVLKRRREKQHTRRHVISLCNLDRSNIYLLLL